ncbi:TetR/AcrR family transcriptional regulator [Cryptosporangium sp. NPDC048952]|uniref:TetR/AcrR family transcriptional regulator n=1 Tax=Cryptosporangium sp. NPDC048952 TaxID=3363961 RepID=UPI0037247A0C
MRAIPDAMAAKVMTAADLFVEQGLDGAKISDIATVTGIPRATLYYYFEGKEGVFGYIIGVVVEAFEEAIEKALAGPGTAADRLSAVIRAQLDIYAAYPAALLALKLDLGRLARRPEIMRTAVRNYVRPVAELLEEGARDGSLRKVPQPDAVAAALLASMTFAAQQSLQSTDATAITDFHASMLSVVLTGLGPEARS